MKNTTVNLGKLQSEIDSRKQTITNGNAINGVQPRMAFLHGLVESLQKNIPTHSSELIKEVDNKVAIKNNEKPVFKPNSSLVQTTQNRNQPKQQPQQLNEIDDIGREELMYQKLNSKQKGSTLYGEIENLIQPQYPNQQYPLQYPNQQYPNYPQYPNQQPQVMNESVENICNKYLNENLLYIVEDSFKNAVVEMYAVERIKQVLTENKEIIRGVILEVFKEIQSKKKTQ